MMMRRFTIAAVLVLAFGLSCCKRENTEFQIDVINGYTPVKDQGQSQTCWAYAMLSAIETEHIMRGDSVHLSVAYVEKMVEREPKASAKKRGMGITLVNMIQKYGLVPYESMRDTLIPPPHMAFMYGAQYTVQEFARSVCSPDEYIGVGSDKHYPLDTMFEPQLTDNWEHNQLYNLSRDSLFSLTEKAVRQHRGVCWEGDTSEMGYDWKEGVARPSFISGHTTDDHCMAIVGLAHDKDGERYFVMKNSWGRSNKYGGLLFMHEDYFRQKTIAVYLPRDLLF